MRVANIGGSRTDNNRREQLGQSLPRTQVILIRGIRYYNVIRARNAGHLVVGARLTDLQPFWQRVRARAGLNDVRIHDLRHTFASTAVASGQGLPMIG